MTKAQKKTVARIMEWVAKYDCYGSHKDFEIKAFDVIQAKYGLIEVNSIAGRKDGFEYTHWEWVVTMRKLVIGPRGGVTAFVWIRNREKNTFREKVFSGWTAAMESGYSRYGDDTYGKLPPIE